MKPAENFGGSLEVSHPLYGDALSGWERRGRVALADGARKRTEVFWINPADAAMRARLAAILKGWRG